MKLCERMTVVMAVWLSVGAGWLGEALGATTNRVLVSGPPTFTFSPNVLNISVGDTVLWTNVSSTSHDVTQGTQLAGATPNPYWTPLNLNLFGRASVTFSNAGAYPFICNTHVRVNPQPGPQTGLVNVATLNLPDIHLTAVGLEPSGFRFTYTSDPGQRYVIEGSTSPNAPTPFLRLATNTANSSVETFIDPEAGTRNGRAYRVFRQP